MEKKKAARRIASYGRAKDVHQDADIVAQTEHLAGAVIGVAFGLMFMIGIMGGF